MSDLLSLAERCEQATGPSASLDLAIGCAVAPDEREPPYTASLDAAMTLVPEGWSVQIGQGWRCDIKEGLSWASVADRQFGPAKATGDAENVSTPALALCAAALRARAA